MSLNKRKLSERDKKYVSSKQDWKCGYCNNLLPPSYQVDHIIPYSITKDDDIDNLMSLCPTCHANKTQSEYNRILQFKKLKAETNMNLCWFCLENQDDEHKCNRELKSIINKPKLNSTNIDSLNKFNWIQPMDKITKSMSNLNVDSKLRIRLHSPYIYVNSFFTPSVSFSIEEIAKAVSTATRTKRDSKRYDEVEISIENDGNEAIIDFLNENLPSLLPQRIFKNDEVTYSYLF